eukprot:CAMPEP_0197692418 /NCGR_PEP_ID=MMETSP1338-20131121/111053_1 /TAXON_ID=43686 ORGANISM="Pelagodinium beii, Strain RCC1491" /NCGR_SAMPLE_ID=MMETSP1338 /ASSEMBLY_ACC=CAM_ASM_000754 /LENGTH=78 /DNA_ID=CAMNT_0043275077 /DNA_START=52 /DNA_END=285 /DNA_ORIENTATION=-
MEDLRRITEQYGPAASYVFSWAQLYAQGLWLLAVPILLFSVLAAAHHPVAHKPFEYLVQASLIAWTAIMSAVAELQRV